jgi:hypothetical protein
MLKNMNLVCECCKKGKHNYPEKICEIIREIYSLDCNRKTFTCRPINSSTKTSDVENYKKLTKAMDSITDDLRKKKKK